MHIQRSRSRLSFRKRRRRSGGCLSIVFSIAGRARRRRGLVAVDQPDRRRARPSDANARSDGVGAERLQPGRSDRRDQPDAPDSASISRTIPPRCGCWRARWSTAATPNTTAPPTSQLALEVDHRRAGTAARQPRRAGDSRLRPASGGRVQRCGGCSRSARWTKIPTMRWRGRRWRWRMAARALLRSPCAKVSTPCRRATADDRDRCAAGAGDHLQRYGQLRRCRAHRRAGDCPQQQHRHALFRAGAVCPADRRHRRGDRRLFRGADPRRQQRQGAPAPVRAFQPDARARSGDHTTVRKSRSARQAGRKAGIGWAWNIFFRAISSRRRMICTAARRCRCMQNVPISERRFECWYIQGQAAEIRGDCESLIAIYNEFRAIARGRANSAALDVSPRRSAGLRRQLDRLIA